jgi:hypothetical protein
MAPWASPGASCDRLVRRRLFGRAVGCHRPFTTRRPPPPRCVAVRTFVLHEDHDLQCDSHPSARCRPTCGSAGRKGRESPPQLR